ERGARMIRGNHEKDYLAVWWSETRPPAWETSPRMVAFRWQVTRVAGERAEHLAALPDQLVLDDATLVVHGSPTDVRAAVLPWKSDEELEALYAGHPARLVFMGHTHRPHVRQLPRRRLVNVGSAGMPLDGDPRACYFLLEDGQVSERRVPYDVEALLAAFDRV